MNLPIADVISLAKAGTCAHSIISQTKPRSMGKKKSCQQMPQTHMSFPEEGEMIRVDRPTAHFIIKEILLPLRPRRGPLLQQPIPRRALTTSATLASPTESRPPRVAQMASRGICLAAAEGRDG